MHIRYNLNVLKKRGNISVYDLHRRRILGNSACTSLYRQQPVRTETLLRVLEFADCRLEEFLVCDRTSVSRRRKLNLDDMVRRGVISRSAKQRFLSDGHMFLSTLEQIAEDQGVRVLDFFRIVPVKETDSAGNLKKRLKVLYLCEW